MAKMYPPYVEECRAHDSGAWGESVVFDALQNLPDDWVVIHDYWRLYMDKRREHVNYELDFIVLVPGKGMVVLEVKNWHQAEVREGEWWFMGKQGQWHAMGHKASPLNQAYLGSKKLYTELCRAAVLNPDRQSRRLVEYHAMAVLLNQVPEAVLPAVNQVEQDAATAQEHAVPLESLYICGQAELYDNLQHKIERIFMPAEVAAKRGYAPLSQEQISRIVSYLLPSFHLRSDPYVYHRLIESATASLHTLLPMLEESTQGICVAGCAGSGKTWMAVREAARLAEKHRGERRVLLLCYNVALAEHLRRLPELQPSIGHGWLQVHAFAELCKQIAGVDFGADREQERRWFLALQSPDRTDAVDEVCSLITEEQRFHYIFIDEGQDFRASWGRVIEKLQKPGAGLYVFSDDNQNLFVHGEQGYCPQLPTRVRLTRNLRNSAEIARFSSSMLEPTHRMVPLDAPGYKVVVQPAVEDAQKRAELVSRWIHFFLRGGGRGELQQTPSAQYGGPAMLPHQIVALSPYAPYKVTEAGAGASPHCTLPMVPELTCRSAELSNEDLLQRWESDEKLILGTTIRSFKGLEADYVILADVDSPLGDDKALSKNDFYVACTRAKYGLIIIPRTPAGEQYARQLLAEAGQA